MRLPFFHPKEPVVAGAAPPRARRAAAAAASNDPGALEAARLRARRRLIGAVVLLGVGIVGFPLVFETKPRPLPIDTPIDASRVDLANPRVASGAVVPQRPLPVLPADAGNEGPAAAVAMAPPAAGPAGPVVASSPAAPAIAMTVPAKPPGTVPVTAPVPVPAPASSPSTAPRAASPTASAAPKSGTPKAPAVAATAAPAVVAAAGPSKASAPAAAAVPALQPPAAEAASAGSTVPRYVVQVGAFNDNTRMREARMKVERIGYTTYISEVDSPTGRRTRVRLGPFTNKDDADAAAVKVKAAGLPANILKL